MAREIGHGTFRGFPYKFVYDHEIHPATSFTFEDEQSVRDLFWDIKPDDVVLDIGAAFGSYTIQALAAGAAHVIAWNPEVDLLQSGQDLLRESIAVNGWQDKCSIVTKGLWSDHGFLDSEGLNFTKEHRPGSFPVEPLDSNPIARECSKIQWVKIDVEGAELEVLKGGKNLIARHMPKFVIENHTFKIPEIKNYCCEFLTALGYDEVATVPYHSVSHSLYIPRGTTP